MSISKTTDARISALEYGLYGSKRLKTATAFSANNIVLTPVATGFQITETVIGGVTLSISANPSQEFLLGSQTNTAQNGIYIIVSLAPTVIKRATTANQYENIRDSLVQILAGTGELDSYLMSTTQPFTIDVTPIIVTQAPFPPGDINTRLENKQNLVSGAVNNNIALLDATGQTKDSGVFITTDNTNNTDTAILTAKATHDAINSSAGGSGTYIPTANTLAKWDLSKNFAANNYSTAIQSTVTSSTSDMFMDVTSQGIQRFTGTQTQIISLPDATTLLNGTKYFFLNDSSGIITIYLSVGSAILTIPANADASIILVDNGTPQGIWHTYQNNSLSAGDLTESTSNILTITGGEGAVLHDVSIEIKQATSSQSGYLSSADWESFDSRLPFITPSVDNNIVTTVGTYAVDSGKAFTTDGTLTANLDTNIPTEKAVKTYADTKQSLVSSATSNDIATLNSSGQVIDSAKSFGNDGTNNTIPTSSQMQSYVTTALINAPTLPFVHFATIANISAFTGLAAIDGYTPTAGQFLLVKNQTNNDNSVWIVASGAWTRAYANSGIWSPITTQTIYSQLNINGGIVNVLNGTANKNLQYQFNIVNPSATFGNSIVYVTALTKLPQSSPTNIYVDATIGNNTNNNGSQSFPYATLANAFNAISTTPAIINLLSNSAFSDSITWTSSKTNVTTQGNNLSDVGGGQTLSGQQIFASGSTYNHFVNTYHSTGSTAPFAFQSGALCRNNFKNITIVSTATDWLGLNAGCSNFIRLNNIAFQTAGINAINLPAFTNPFTIYIDQQDLFKGALLFTGTGSITTTIVIDAKVGAGQVRLPSTFLGTVIFQNTSFGASLGSVAHPIGLVTTQADLTTILNWITNTTYDGFYAITGFTPTTFTAGSIFGKQTLGGVATNIWRERQPSYCPPVARDSSFVYQFNATTSVWSAVGSGAGITSVLNTTLTTTITSADVAMTVGSTNGFSPSGILYIDNESISYTGKTATTFTGLTRGLYGTTPATHNSAAVITSLGLPYNSGTASGGDIIGVIMAYTGSTAPVGAFICDGSTYSRSTYSALFAKMGTSHGAGDGSTTFHIPDYRGRFIRGVDGTAGRDPDSASRTAMNTGGNTGNQIGSVQLDAFASHTHTIAGDASDSAGGGTRWASGNSNNGFKGISSGIAQSTGGSETRVKSGYENWIVWYNNPGGFGDVYLANNNAFTGNNAFSGTTTLNGQTTLGGTNLTNASGTFKTLVLDSSNNIKTQPPSASITSTAISFLSSPPVSPNVDDTYIIQPTGAGIWAGHDNQIATWDGSQWGYYIPQTNDIASLITGDLYQFNGTAWISYSQAGGSFLKQTITSSLTLTTWQREIRVNATSNSIVVTIPQTLSGNVSQEIVVTRIDNTSNTVSVVAYTGQTINGASTIYLYSQYDSIKISSNGSLNSSDIITDSRNNGGSGTKSYLVNELATQAGLVTGTTFSYPLVPNYVSGNNVTMSSIGNILIKGNSGVYNLESNVNRTGSTASDEFSWGFYNVTTGIYFGQCGSMETANNTSPTVGYGGIAWATVNPTVDTVYQVRCTKATGTHTLDANGQAGQVASVLRVDQISAPANVINTTGYLSAIASTTQTLSTVGQILAFGNIQTGSNIAFDGTTATLMGGKTYWLEFTPIVVGAGTNLSVQWYNVTTSTYFGQTILIYPTNEYSNPLKFAISFTQNTQVQLRVVGPVTASGTLGDGSRNIYPTLNIQQIGTTPIVTTTATAIPQLAKNVTGTSCRGVVFIHRNQLWQMGVYGGPGSSTSATANCTIPTLVPINNTGLAISGWQDVAYSYDSAIALTTDGRVFYWGYNNITSAFQPIATLVPGLSSVVVAKIYCCVNKGNTSNNSFYCITTTGALYTFGDNTWGQLGLGNNTNQTTAQLVTTFNGKIITKVSVSGNASTHVAAIDTTGQLYTWGYGAQGTSPVCNPLGSGVANTNSNVPITIAGFTNVTDAWAASEYTASSGSNNFTRVLRSDGSSWATGNNSTGQLATGNTISSSSFVRESLNKTNISAIYAYETYNGGCSVIIDTSGILYFSGNNNDACFGDGSTNNSAHTTFTNTTQLNNAGFQGKMLMGTSGIQPKIIMMGTANGGYNTAVILDNTGTVWATGRYQEGQTSNPNSSTSTAFMSAIAGTKGTPIVDIKAVGLNGVDAGIIMLFQDGTMMTAGTNTAGALGNETIPSNTGVPYGRYVIGYSVSNS